MGLDILSGISAGSGLIGGVIDAITANSRMKEAEGFSDQQALTQRNWALQDRQHAEDYNSPTAIMARYKAAGLNPNLIYGNNGFASPTVRSTPAAQPYIAQPGIGKAVASTISEYQDARMKNQAFENAQLVANNLRVDNLSKQADVVKKNMQNIIQSYNPLVYASSDERDRAYHQAQEEEKYQEGVFNVHAISDLNQQKAKDEAVKATVDTALQSNSILLGVQAGLQALQKTGIMGKQSQMLDKLLESQELKNELLKMQQDMQNGGFNANSPLVRQLLGGIIDAAMMYMGGKMAIPFLSSPSGNYQRPQFQPGVPLPGGTYRPPNSGFSNSALYNRSDIYNR